MKRVGLLSGQPLIVAGLEAALAGSTMLTLSGTWCSMDDLYTRISAGAPDVLLVDLTDSITLPHLARVATSFPESAVVLWVDRVSAEFASQTIAAGIRGILRRCSPIEAQLQCLEKVAAGELWVEQNLCHEMLSARRVPLTRRERDLVGLLAEGLKNKELAYQLGLTEGTVKVYLARLFRKVGAKDRFELAMFALKNFYSHSACEALAGARHANNVAAPTKPPFPFQMLITPHPGVTARIVSGGDRGRRVLASGEGRR